MRTLTAFAVAFAALCGLARTQEKAGIPENVAKELGYYVGEWTVEGDIGGKPLQGQWSAQWAPHKHCILINSHLVLGDEQVSSNGVSGWDAGQEQIVTVQSLSNGVIEDTRYKIAAPGVLKGVYAISAAGEPIKVECEVRAQQPNEWTFKSSANVFAGEKGNEFTLRFVRSQAISPVYEHLKDLEDYIGAWVAEHTLTQDMPGFAKAGEKVTYQATARWTQNKAIMNIDFTATTADGNATHERWMFGWDAVNKKVMYSGFDSLGGRVWGTTKKESPDTWIWENNWIDANGTQGSGVSTTTMLDNNTAHSHQFTNMDHSNSFATEIDLK